LDLEGSVGRNVTLTRFPDGALYHHAVGSLGDGSIITFVSERLAPEVKEKIGRYRLRFILLKHTSEGESVVELERFPGFEGHLVRLPQGMLGNIGEAPFGRTTRFAIDGSHILAFTNDTYTIQEYDSDGNLTASIRREHKFVNVTHTHVNAYRDKWITAYGDEDDHLIRRRLAAQLEYPEVMPAYRQAILDRVGNLWIEEYRTPWDERPRWMVFNPAGLVVAYIETPASFTLHDIGADKVHLVETNELGDESLTLSRLNPGL
jgi:hypothetical protein